MEEKVPNRLHGPRGDLHAIIQRADILGCGKSKCFSLFHYFTVWSHNSKRAYSCRWYRNHWLYTLSLRSDLFLFPLIPFHILTVSNNFTINHLNNQTAFNTSFPLYFPLKSSFPYTDCSDYCLSCRLSSVFFTMIGLSCIMGNDLQHVQLVCAFSRPHTESNKS